jgi:exonuclease III
MLMARDADRLRPEREHMATRAVRGTEETTVPLRLATWNMNHWQQPMLPVNSRHAAWDYLATSGLDVVLAQEAAPTKASGGAVYGEIGGHRDWGSAVVALTDRVEVEPIRSVRVRYSRRRFLLDKTHPGSVAVARLSIGDIQPITLVSVYGVWDGSPVGSMLRVIADLLPLFESSDGARVILGGDFNVSRSTSSARGLEQAEAVFAAVRSLGLMEAKGLVTEPPVGAEDCLCTGGPACGHIPTWKRSELDHLFVSPSLASQVTSLTIDSTAVSTGLSDHVPMMLGLELTAERTPHTWDEDAFAVEIGRRHGTKAREIVEQLVNWADVKERELTTIAGVHSKVLTRFPTNGCTVDPELIWRLDREAEPKAVMNLFSIHADGQAVIHFGGMRLEPFDSPGNRHVIRRALNEMDGVDIAENEIYRWPRFRVEVLAEPENLARFVAVIDILARDTLPALELVTIRPWEVGGCSPAICLNRTSAPHPSESWDLVTELARSRGSPIPTRSDLRAS